MNPNNNFDINQFNIILNLMNQLYPNCGYNMNNFNMYNNQILMNFMMNWMMMNPFLLQMYNNMKNNIKNSQFNSYQKNNQNFNKMNFINVPNSNPNQPNVAGGGVLPNNLQDINYDITSSIDNSPKVNIIFTTQKGHKMNIVCSYKTKIKDLFTKYVARLGLGPAVMGDSLFFLFNGAKIKQDDNRNVEELGFGLIDNPNIVVLDIKGIIGS